MDRNKKYKSNKIKQTGRYRLWAALFLALLVIVYWFTPLNLFGSRAVVYDDLDEMTQDETEQNRYYRMVDEAGRTLLITGRRLRVGDRYLTADNRLFEVIAVEEYLARARFIENVEIKPERWPAFSQIVSPGSYSRSHLPAPVQAGPSYKIGIYHTHNAESYVPSDGTDSIYGRGGIHDVGVAFKEALEKKGITVLHSEQLHLPHDRGAYRRSRNTVQQLLAQGPDAIFDVHRDAAPWEAYARELDGEWISQILLVVGRSNPGVALNRTFAYDLKGYADQIHPGLVRGVLLAWGGYNQDLFPLNLLLEVGAHTNTKQSAINGITRFADVVAFYFYGPEVMEEERGTPPEGRAEDDPLPPALYRDAGGIYGAISGTVIGLMLASLSAALGFYFLNNPGSLEKVYHWWEQLPERLYYLVYAGRIWVVALPGVMKMRWRQFPNELEQAWYDLREEARHFPVILKALAGTAQRYSIDLAKGGKQFINQVPENLNQSRKQLAQEVVQFPGWLSGYASDLMKRGRVTISELKLNRLRESWLSLKYEAIERSQRIIEWLTRMRNRLRP